VLVDGNAEAKGKEYFRFGGASHSPDHKLTAFGFDDKGSEFFTLVLRDAGTGENLADIIPDTSGSAVWSADSSHVFYIKLDENHRPSKLYRHKIGTQSIRMCWCTKRMTPASSCRAARASRATGSSSTATTTRRRNAGLFPPTTRKPSHA
jgi:protease II